MGIMLCFPCAWNELMASHLYVPSRRWTPSQRKNAVACGIRKNITFHGAQYTFAITVMPFNVVSLETVPHLVRPYQITTTQATPGLVEYKISQD
jgi:hypothetical protein